MSDQKEKERGELERAGGGNCLPNKHTESIHLPPPPPLTKERGVCNGEGREGKVGMGGGGTGHEEKGDSAFA